MYQIWKHVKVFFNVLCLQGRTRIFLTILASTIAWNLQLLALGMKGQYWGLRLLALLAYGVDSKWSIFGLCLLSFWCVVSQSFGMQLVGPVQMRLRIQVILTSHMKVGFIFNANWVLITFTPNYFLYLMNIRLGCKKLVSILIWLCFFSLCSGCNI
jgi:hypothetical protein